MSEIKPMVSSEAVQEKTGKGWDEWFQILDAAGAQKMDHKAIVAYLVQAHQVSPWWQQMIAVSYEQTRGLRQKHEKPEGYQISRSKTMGFPVERIYEAWSLPDRRAAWLPDPAITIRTATPNKSMRVTWVDGRTSLDVAFYPKGPEKCQVTVQHNRLPDAAAAEAMKTYWSEALARLQTYLTGRS